MNILQALSCNEVGCSSQSGEVRVDTSKENPVPRLITATDSTIDLFLPDAQTSAELWNRTSAVALTFEAQESALYLLDTSSRIVKLVEVNGHEVSIYKMYSINWSLSILTFYCLCLYFALLFL